MNMLMDVRIIVFHHKGLANFKLNTHLNNARNGPKDSAMFLNGISETVL